MDLYGEFAVDPAALKTWRDIKDLYSHFGYSHGPLISRFPSRWLADLKSWGQREFRGTTRITEFTEKLKYLEQYALIPSGRPYNGERNWIQNAIDSHGETPFSRILSCDTNIGLHDDVLDYEVLDDETLGQYGQCLLNQNSDEFCRATRILLQNSKNIKFIDPYLSSRNLTTLTSMIDLATNSGQRSPEFEVHTSNIRNRVEIDIDEEIRFYRDGFRRNLAKMQKITVYWWQDIQTAEIHPRYLITEKGGIKFDKGFTQPHDHAERTGQFPAMLLKQNMATEIDNKFRETLTTYECVRRIEYK